MATEVPDISPIQKRVLLKLSAVIDNGFGELRIVVRDKRVVDIVPELPDDRQVLAELQKDFTKERR